MNINKNLTKLICGQAVSQFGRLIFSIFSMWIAYTITQNQMYVGLIGAIQLISTLIAPLGGVLADRFDKRKLLMFIDLFRFLILIIFSIVFYFNEDSIVILALTVFLLSFSSGIFVPTFDAIVPEYVEKNQLLKANGFITVFFQIATILGASIGGAVIMFSQIYWASLLNASTFLISFIFIFTLPHLNKKMNNSNASEITFFRSFIEGLTYIKNNKFIVRVIPIALIANLCFWTIWALLPKWVNINFGENALYYSSLEIGLSIGAIIGGIILGVLNKKINRLGLLFICGSILQGVTLLIFSFNHSIIFSLVLWLTYGIFNTIGSSAYFTTLQMKVPDEILGRVMGTVMMIFSITTPLGALFSGFLNKILSVNDLMFTSALLMTLAPLTLIFFKEIVNLNASD